MLRSSKTTTVNHGAQDPQNVKRYHFLRFLEIVITFDWTPFCLLCDTPKQSEEGELSGKSYQFSPETLSFQNIRISKIGWVL